MTRLDVSEQQFSAQVEDALKTFGWHYCHFRPARTEHGWRTAISGYKGWPDYVAVKGDRMFVFELKSEKGKVTEAEREWLDVLGNVPHLEIGVFRPSEFEGVLLPRLRG